MRSRAFVWAKRGARRGSLPGGLAASLVAAWTGVAAQEPDPTAMGAREGITPGKVVERVISTADTSQSWAVYVPGRYDPGRAWPILFVMDPRGRALLPLERLIEPAERYGYVVMSSWNTASDFLGPDPNEPALAAMLEDAQRLFRLDGRRLYLVGFSGTARTAWSLTTRLTGHVAGIIGVGGGLPPPLYEADLSPLREHAGFGFYGLAGTRDFNHDDMWRVAELLDRHGIANGLAIFEGPHTWAPAELLAQAIDWMELRAMRTGLRPVDPLLVDSLWERRNTRARERAEAGELVEAWREYDALGHDFEGLVDVGAARREADRLRATKAVAEGVARRKALRDRFWAVVDRLDDILFHVRLRLWKPDPDRLADQLGLEALLAEAEDPGDPLAAAAALRVLEHVFVNVAFYEPRTLIPEGRIDEALAMLDVAERIFRERPQVCLFRARAFAAAERADDAVAAVRCALEAGLPARALADDPGLESLRELEEFRALLGAGSGRVHEVSQRADGNFGRTPAWGP